MSFTNSRFIITGGAGFIGSNFLCQMAKRYPQTNFINLDCLTYAANLKNVEEISNQKNYKFIKGDIADASLLNKIIEKDDIIVNFAAETHVDNSIADSDPFIRNNVLGVQTILDVARKKSVKLFIQISTDEVYGSLNLNSPSSRELDRLLPSSPYSASKAAAEMLCMASIKTFKQPIIVARSSNNFGPYQYPEKIIPLFTTNLIKDQKIPIFGRGNNIRDWIYVQDTCEAIEFILKNGHIGEIYNIGAGNEVSNIHLAKMILKIFKKGETYIDYIPDRLGHDQRYSLNCSKLESLGWHSKYKFSEALQETIQWYVQNLDWWPR